MLKLKGKRFSSWQKLVNGARIKAPNALAESAIGNCTYALASLFELQEMTSFWLQRFLAAKINSMLLERWLCEGGQYPRIGWILDLKVPIK